MHLFNFSLIYAGIFENDYTTIKFLRVLPWPLLICWGHRYIYFCGQYKYSIVPALILNRIGGLPQKCLETSIFAKSKIEQENEPGRRNPQLPQELQTNDWEILEPPDRDERICCRLCGKFMNSFYLNESNFTYFIPISWTIDNKKENNCGCYCRKNRRNSTW